MTGFADFWSIYPRKVARRAAEKEWDKEMRAGTDPEAIISGLRGQLPALSRKEPQFIPHARTWLHQGRWEDEPEPERPRNYADAARKIIHGSERVFSNRDDVQFVSGWQRGH